MEDVASAQRVHSPPIPSTPYPLPTITYHQVMPPAPPAPAIPHLPNQVAPPQSLNGFYDLYYSESYDNSILYGMVGSNDNPIKSISSYIISPLVLELDHIPPKVAKKQCKTLNRHKISSIRQTQSDATASARFLSTELQYVTQAIICTHTDKIALYNRSE